MKRLLAVLMLAGLTSFGCSSDSPSANKSPNDATLTPTSPSSPPVEIPGQSFPPNVERLTGEPCRGFSLLNSSNQQKLNTVISEFQAQPVDRAFLDEFMTPGTWINQQTCEIIFVSPKGQSLDKALVERLFALDQVKNTPQCTFFHFAYFVPVYKYGELLLGTPCVHQDPRP